MSMKEKEQALIEEFALFDDWMDKYDYIIEMSKEMEPLSEEEKSPSYLISGCQSQLWLYPVLDKGRLFFKVDSDAVITKGIANVVLRVVNGETPEAVLQQNFDFINKIGLKEHLSPTRSNGLDSLLKQIKLYALVYKTKKEQQ